MLYKIIKIISVSIAIVSFLKLFKKFKNIIKKKLYPINYNKINVLITGGSSGIGKWLAKLYL